MRLQCLREHFDSAADFTRQAAIWSRYTQTYSVADNTVTSHEMGSSTNGTAVLNGVRIIWNTDWMATQTWQQMHIKNATLHKTPEVLGPRVRRKGNLSPLPSRCRRAAQLCGAPSYFRWGRMETWIFAILKNGFTRWRQRFQKSSWWSGLSLRGNLRYLQRPCLRGHLISGDGRLLWICTTVTRWSAFFKGEHWTIRIWILQKAGVCGPTGNIWAYRQTRHNSRRCLNAVECPRAFWLEMREKLRPSWCIQGEVVGSSLRVVAE